MSINIKSTDTEELSPAPKFLADSYTRDYFELQDFAPQVFQVSTEDRYRRDRVTTGISYTF